MEEDRMTLPKSVLEPASAVRVAIVGCGAVAEKHHAAALAALERRGLLRVVKVVDGAAERAALMTTIFPKAVAVPLEAINSHTADLALVATPAALHRQHCLKLLTSGVHVLCEKPLTANAADARSIADAAAQAGRICAVSFQRRLWGSCNAIAKLLQDRWLGEITEVSLSAGGPFGWDAATDSFFRKETAGGGVLLDLGIHLLDVLCWWVGIPKITSYEDDREGGIEANCHVRFRWENGLTGRMNLSRQCPCTNLLSLSCERGVIEWGVFDTSSFVIKSPDFHGRVDASLPSAPGISRTTTAEEGLYIEMLGAIAGGKSRLVGAGEAADTLALIDDCYRNAKAIPRPWVELPRLPAQTRARPLDVAILGASGFVGGRLFEIMCHHRGGLNPRPIVRRAISLSNLARFDHPWHRADVLDCASLVRAFEGCDVVVDTQLPQLDKIGRAAEQVVRAAAEAGVRRIVYLSSQVIFGADPKPGVEERWPLARGVKDIYARGKIAAERALLRGTASAGIELVILRPGIVYGPWSRWISILAERFSNGTGWLHDGGRGVCNAISVDNLAHAIIQAIEAPALSVDACAFFVNDSEEVSWADFCAPLARAAGLDPDAIPSAPPHHIQKSVSQMIFDLRSTAPAQMLLPLVPSRLKQSVKAGLREWAAAGPANSATDLSEAKPVLELDLELFRLQHCRWRFSSDEARTRLGFNPPVTFVKGIMDAISWWRWTRQFQAK